ncbi:MAG: glycosyl transferase family 39, partial [Cyanobacteria bacterium P01_D01_bin.115]
ILSFSSLFFDLDMGLDHPMTYLIRLPFIILIVAALYQVWIRSSHLASGFVLTSIIVPFLALALPDLILGGQRSAITRYLICSFPGVQLAVAYLLGTYLLRRRIWQGIWAIVLTASLASCVVSAYSSTWWNKGVSYANAETASMLNRLDAPLVISDRGDSYLNQGNLISLSYRLDADVQLLLIDYDAIVEGLATVQHPENTEVLLYSPSNQLRSQVEAKWGSLTPISSQDVRLWRFESSQLTDQ